MGRRRAGGDLGYFQRGNWPRIWRIDFRDESWRGVGRDRTKQGLSAEGQRAHPGHGTLKEAGPKIQDALYYEKLQPALRTYLTKLREDAYIEIKPGYVDSGASRTDKFVQTKGADRAPRTEEEQEAGLFRAASVVAWPSTS